MRTSPICAAGAPEYNFSSVGSDVAAAVFALGNADAALQRAFPWTTCGVAAIVCGIAVLLGVISWSAEPSKCAEPSSSKQPPKGEEEEEKETETKGDTRSRATTGATVAQRVRTCLVMAAAGASLVALCVALSLCLDAHAAFVAAVLAARDELRRLALRLDAVATGQVGRGLCGLSGDCTAGHINVTGSGLSAVTGRAACGVAETLCGALGHGFAASLAFSLRALDGIGPLWDGRTGRELSQALEAQLALLGSYGVGVSLVLITAATLGVVCPQKWPRVGAAAIRISAIHLLSAACGLYASTGLLHALAVVSTSVCAGVEAAAFGGRGIPLVIPYGGFGRDKPFGFEAPFRIDGSLLSNAANDTWSGGGSSSGGGGSGSSNESMTGVDGQRRLVTSRNVSSLDAMPAQLRAALAYSIFNCSACGSETGPMACQAQHCTSCRDDDAFCTVWLAFGLPLRTWKADAEALPSLLVDEQKKVRLSSSLYTDRQMTDLVHDEYIISAALASAGMDDLSRALSRSPLHHTYLSVKGELCCHGVAAVRSGVVGVGMAAVVCSAMGVVLMLYWHLALGGLLSHGIRPRPPDMTPAREMADKGFQSATVAMREGSRRAAAARENSRRRATVAREGSRRRATVAHEGSRRRATVWREGSRWATKVGLTLMGSFGLKSGASSDDFGSDEAPASAAPRESNGVSSLDDDDFDAVAGEDADVLGELPSSSVPRPLTDLEEEIAALEVATLEAEIAEIEAPKPRPHTMFPSPPRQLLSHQERSRALPPISELEKEIMELESAVQEEQSATTVERRRLEEEIAELEANLDPVLDGAGVGAAAPAPGGTAAVVDPRDAEIARLRMLLSDPRDAEISRLRMLLATQQRDQMVQQV